MNSNLSNNKKIIFFIIAAGLAATAVFFGLKKTSSETTNQSPVMVNVGTGSSDGTTNPAGAATSPPVDCSKSSPFEAITPTDGCAPNAPNAAALDQSGFSFEENVFREFKSPLARGVRLMWPGAAIQAYETRAKKCLGSAVIREEDTAQIQECDELRRVNGTVLLTLSKDADDGDTAAALIFAKHSFKRALHFEKKYQRDPFIANFDKYAKIAATKPENEDVLNNLREQLDKIR